MKLYATLKNDRGGKKSTGDDTRILITLSYGNKELGTIGLYSIIDDKVEGYRIIWDKGSFPTKVIEHLEKQKGNTLKDEKAKNPCGHELCSPDICGNDLPF